MAATNPSEVDVLLNRVNVALARSKKLVASWLPPPTEEELANTKSQEEIEREEEEIFQPVPDRLGLGAAVPTEIRDGSFNRDQLASNVKLRQKLLGKRALNASAGINGAQKRGVTQPRLGSKSIRTYQHQSESESEEEGRAAMFSSRKSKGKPSALKTAQQNSDNDQTRPDPGNTDSTDLINEQSDVPGQIKSAPKGNIKRKKPSNYLDELLAERERKGKKKKCGKVDA